MDPSNRFEGSILTLGLLDGLADGDWLMDGVDEGLEEGVWLIDGAELGFSSTNRLSAAGLSPLVRSTVILFGSPPSLSNTSTKPSGVTSLTMYVPGCRSGNSKLPLSSVVVVPTGLSSESYNSTVTFGMGLSPTSSLSTSSRTVPEMVRGGSSTKSTPFLFSPPPSVMVVLLSLSLSMSDTSK